MKKYKVVYHEFENGKEYDDILDLVNVNNDSERLMAAPDEFYLDEVIEEDNIVMKYNNYIDENGNYGKAQFAHRKKETIPVFKIDPGDTVLCDLCNRNYTNSEEIGGFLFQSKAVCPKCAKEFMKTVKKYHEERFIRSVVRENETFRDFVYRVRKGEY